jgi:hypothetical protein
MNCHWLQQWYQIITDRIQVIDNTIAIDMGCYQITHESTDYENTFLVF